MDEIFELERELSKSGFTITDSYLSFDKVGFGHSKKICYRILTHLWKIQFAYIKNFDRWSNSVEMEFDIPITKEEFDNIFSKLVDYFYDNLH